jgi:PAS domain S-box-containing protein
MMTEYPVAHPHTETSSTLADLLALRRGELVQRWLSRLPEKPTGNGHTQARLEDCLDGYLRQVVAALRHRQDGEATRMSPAAPEHESQRLHLGFNGEMLVHEYDLLRECIFDLVEESGVSISLAEVRTLTTFIAHSAAESASEHSLRQQEALRAAEAERARLLEQERRAHREMEEALELLDTLLAAAPFGQAFLNRELRYVRINQLLADINGVPVERTLGRSMWEILPELAPRLEPIYRRVLETGQPVLEAELSGTTPGTGDQMHHWLASFYPVRDSTGSIFLVGNVVLDITNRRRAEQRLRQSEERFRLLVEGVTDYAIFMLDPEGRVASWNPGAERIKGWKAEEILGQPFTRFYPPEDVEAGRPQENLHRAATQGHHHEEGWRVRKDGSRFWADVHIAAQRDEQGVLRGYTKITRDISEQRQAEEALRGMTQRLQAILQTAVDGIITINEQGLIQNVNPATERIFGYTPEELFGRNVCILMPEPYRHEHDGYMDNYLRTGVRKIIGIGREVRGRRKDGSTFPMELAVSEVRLPEGRFFTGIVRDITARKRAEEIQTLFVEVGTLLARSLDAHTTLKDLAALVVSRLSDSFAVDLLGEDGELHRVEVATRYPERQALLRRTMRFPSSMKGPSPMAQALASGQPLAVPEVTPAWLDAAAQDAEHRALLEELAPRSIILVPLVARGRTLGLLDFCWSRSRSRSISADVEVARGVADRTAMALDNARLYQEAQEAIRAREDVVAIVSHDLRNPLNAIVLSAQALLKREDVDERTTKAISRIYSSADRATRMIRDLLDFSQARMGGIPVQRGPLDFHEHVRRVVEEVQLAHPERPIEFHSSGDGQGEWDADRLAQVVTNLVGNAVQHGSPGSSVRVTTRGEGSTVTLSVDNDGTVIPDELLLKLFEPYRRGVEAGTRRGSLGLGLFITRQIVLGHGGSIDVRSTAEEGTTFTVRLPRRA